MSCPRTDSVQQSRVHGPRDPELEIHAGSCDACRAVIELSPFFEQLAASSLDASIPDARMVWLKAQIIQSRRQVRHVQKTLDVLQLLPWAGVALCWAGLIAAKWSQILASLQDFSLGRFLYLSFTGGSALPITLIVVVLGLMTVTAGMALHSILREE